MIDFLYQAFQSFAEFEGHSSIGEPVPACRKHPSLVRQGRKFLKFLPFQNVCK